MASAAAVAAAEGLEPADGRVGGAPVGIDLTEGVRTGVSGLGTLGFGTGRLGGWLGAADGAEGGAEGGASRLGGVGVSAAAGVGAAAAAPGGGPTLLAAGVGLAGAGDGCCAAAGALAGGAAAASLPDDAAGGASCAFFIVAARAACVVALPTLLPRGMTLLDRAMSLCALLSLRLECGKGGAQGWRMLA